MQIAHVIHVAFSKKAGIFPLKELLHSDSVLQDNVEATRLTINLELQ
jgi:hypothetical protein